MSRGTTSKSKQRARKTATRRPAHRDDDLALFDAPCQEILRSDGRRVLRSGDPLEAELWASHLLGTFEGLPIIGTSDATSAIGGRLVTVARRSATPAAQVCLRALAAVAPGNLSQRAASAVRGRGSTAAPAPRWAEAIGTAQPTEAWRASDLCGDQDSIMLGFVYPDGLEHSIVVLVDHVLGGIAKDIAVLGPLAFVLETWRNTSAIELVAEPFGVAAGRVLEAMEWTSRTVDAPITEDYTPYRALVQARLSPLAASVPARDVLSHDEREILVQEFLAHAAGQRYNRDSTAWFLLDTLVDYRCDYHHGDPLRWSAGSALLFLLDFVPRKISAEPDTLQRAPEVLREWITWASQKVGLPHEHLAETIEAIGEAEGDFTETVADESRWGPAKRAVMQMLAEGVDPTDPDAVNDWIGEQRTARSA